jgi:hypothetical protein
MPVGVSWTSEKRRRKQGQATKAAARTDGAPATTKPDKQVEGDDLFGEMMAQAFGLEIAHPVSAV